MGNHLDTGFDMTDDTKDISPSDVFPNDKAKKNRTAGYAEKAIPKNRSVVPNKKRFVGKPNAKIKSLVKHIADGKSYADAQVAAGIPLSETAKNPHNYASQALARPYVQEMLAAERQDTAQRHRITRDNVIAGLKEAIDMARVMSEPGIMIAGWKEIGKMCGLYEQVKVKVDLSSGGVTLSTQIAKLSDEDLLRLAAGETIDGDFADNS